ncbi:MAG: putative transcriptional regulator, GntR family [Pseudonocardia sp.]|nr:putative transcriptional regulator, GntR family [Pseudonocardia sp.]
MGGTAVVYPLDGPTTVERVCTEIGDSIHAGHLRPGQELSLREVAEQRRVRLRTLTQLVTGLERDGLLVRRGDVAIVAPLNLDELTSAFKLRRIVETSLLTRAGALIPDHELDRLAAAIPTEVGQDTDATFGAAMRQFNLGLLRPAATNVDLGVIRHIHHATRRYHCLGIEALRQNGVQGGGLLRHLDRCHQLIALIRARDLASARSLARLIIDDSEVLALRSFELDGAGTGRLVGQPAGSLATRVSTS